MSLFRKKSSTPQLNLETAGKILEQTFEANKMEKNTIPLEVLVSYSSYRKERFSLQRTMLVIIMVLFLLLPLLFIPSSFTIREDDAAKRTYNPVYRLEVDSPMLVERVGAVIDGYNVPLYEVDSHVYLVEPPRNGEMTVTVTLANGQSHTEYVEVANVDREIPAATSCVKEGDIVNLYLSDNLSGVDFGALEAYDLNGNRVVPVSTDSARGCVSFSTQADTLNVYIPDRAGNKLHLVLTIP